jgi:hypothetical protein
MNAPVQLHQLSDQAAGEQGEALELDHQPVGEVLLKQRP